ncbi:FUSC family protein [Streptomyces bambusae]|uniref:FUSC family protein n=1 Tax=Streptomyces bambusae TaxID=1550616 RepID=UPI001CFDCE93|nr:FUSC family protein [Streptomyces bambusae]MCB5167555.1 FUSC family protein [Streptomyces bambusae]
MSSAGAGASLAGRARAVLAADGPAAARILVTVVVSWQVALWLGADQPPVYAAIVPLVALRGDPVTALATSVHRVLGVVAGVLIGIAVLSVLRPSTAVLALVVGLGLAVGLVLRADGGPNSQVAVSSLLVLASTAPDAYAFHRMWETGAGAVVTVVLAPLLWPPDPRRILPHLAEDCRARLAQALTGTAAAVGGAPGPARDNLAVVTAHGAAVTAAAARARQAERALRFSPLRRRRRAEVRRMVRAVGTGERVVADVTALAREAVAFAGRPDLVPVLADARPWAAELAAATAGALDLTLSGDDPGPRIAAARGLLAAYVRADARPAAVALRRPFQRILDTLDEARAERAG